MRGHGCIESVRIQLFDGVKSMAVLCSRDRIRLIVVHIGAGDKERLPAVYIGVLRKNLCQTFSDHLALGRVSYSKHDRDNLNMLPSVL